MIVSEPLLDVARVPGRLGAREILLAQNFPLEFGQVLRVVPGAGGRRGRHRRHRRYDRDHTGECPQRVFSASQRTDRGYRARQRMYCLGVSFRKLVCEKELSTRRKFANGV